MGVWNIPLEIGADWGVGLWFPESEIKSHRCDGDKGEIYGGDVGREGTK